MALMDRTAVLLLISVILLTTAACTSDKARREGELAKLAGDLPGQYESTDKMGGMLAILPVHAGMIGDRVFYLEPVSYTHLTLPTSDLV